MLNTSSCRRTRSRSTSSAARARSPAAGPADHPGWRAHHALNVPEPGSTSNRGPAPFDPASGRCCRVDQVTGVGTIIQPGDPSTWSSFEDPTASSRSSTRRADGQSGPPRSTVLTFVRTSTTSSTTPQQLIQDSKVLAPCSATAGSGYERGHTGPRRRPARSAQWPAADRHPAADAAAGRAGSLRPAGRQHVARPSGGEGPRRPPIATSASRSSASQDPGRPAWPDDLRHHHSPRWPRGGPPAT